MQKGEDGSTGYRQTTRSSPWQKLAGRGIIRYPGRGGAGTKIGMENLMDGEKGVAGMGAAVGRELPSSDEHHEHAGR